MHQTQVELEEVLTGAVAVDGHGLEGDQPGDEVLEGVGAPGDAADLVAKAGVFEIAHPFEERSPVREVSVDRLTGQSGDDAATSSSVVFSLPNCVKEAMAASRMRRRVTTSRGSSSTALARRM